MATSASLRRTLRTVPALRSLPNRELDAIAARMVCKEYHKGSTLWRVGTHLDFVGFVHRGEITLEYRHDGSGMRQARLSAGDFVGPRDVRHGPSPSSVSARAATDVTLYVLRLDHLAALQSAPSTAGASAVPALRGRTRRLPWNRLWAFLLVLLVLSLVWRDVTSTLAGLLYLASGRIQADENPHQALQWLDYAARLDPEAALACNQAGYLWFQMDDVQQAESLFDQALDADGTSGPALNNMAVTYFTLGLSRQAVELQQEAAELDPDRAVTHYNRGLMLLAQNRLPEAIRALNEATHIESGWSLPYVYLAYAYLHMGDYAQAEGAARNAIRLDPSQQPAQLCLAIALYHQDRSLEALRPARKALSITPGEPVARFYEALILRDVGLTDMALSALREIYTFSNDPALRVRVATEIEAIRRSSQQIPSQEQ